MSSDQGIRGTFVEDYYEKVIAISNKVLRNCKLFHISILKEENPSFTEVAEHLTAFADIINVLAHTAEMEHKAAKAQEYAANVKQIAEAIEANNETELQRLVDELDRRPFL